MNMFLSDRFGPQKFVDLEVTWSNEADDCWMLGRIEAQLSPNDL